MSGVLHYSYWHLFMTDDATYLIELFPTSNIRRDGMVPMFGGRARILL